MIMNRVWFIGFLYLKLFVVNNFKFLLKFEYMYFVVEFVFWKCVYKYSYLEE